jgi:hypothetical protein
MKTKLNYLSNYLPYDLKYVIDKFHQTTVIRTLKGLPIDLVQDELGVRHHINRCIPLLRPLTDLTNEIEFNGEIFEPFEMMQVEFCDSLELNKPTNESIFIKLKSFERFDDLHRLYDDLFKWHFDVFGLIKKGEAIDLNTLKI